jgi:mannose-6-phosphate isomerase-like protein (cupin superfamily)
MPVDETVVDKPWGREFRIHMDKKRDMWIMEMRAGHGSSLHRHPNKDKLLIVLSGKVSMFRDPDWEGPFEVFGTQAVSRGVLHRQVAHEDSEILEIEYPPCKQDIERVSDVYGRTGKPYEREDV